jgi:hypothetical protein
MTNPSNDLPKYACSKFRALFTGYVESAEPPALNAAEPTYLTFTVVSGLSSLAPEVKG